LNLFLEVLAKRADGFHEIETLMMAISISDSLFVTVSTEGRIRLSCTWASGMESRRHSGLDDAFGDLPPETENIVYKAADRLRSQAGVRGGVSMHLVKRIPSAAGLGGASSDAAAALWALNQAWRLEWSAAQLAELGATIGSDVPFFLSRGGSGVRAAICRGRGERIDPTDGLPSWHVVVVRPPVGLSTAAVYRQCTVASHPRRVDGLLDALRRGETQAVGRALFNRLQQTAEQLCPWIERLRTTFERIGVPGHQMTGSGTSYFGICRNAVHARHVAARLRALHVGEVYRATTIPGW
jgi:4-diphosphocytidyl-2-C-methyl-D-erythritol kinase